MACNARLQAFHRLGGGKPTFKESESNGIKLELPCGQCMGCRIDKSREWTVRIMHEMQMHEDTSFITLTYDDENLPESFIRKKGGPEIPSNATLDHRDFQKFMKRLRKRIPGKKLSYYMCGEYGTHELGGIGRPHYHIILFNEAFIEDREQWRESQNNHTYFRSPLLESCWKNGHSELTDATMQTAAYVARYVLKKITGEKSHTFYSRTCLDTGESVPVAAEYSKCSLRPAIGKDWYTKFSTDVFPSDTVIMNGNPVRSPAYYLKLLKEVSPQKHQDIHQKRIDFVRSNAKNNTKARQDAREKINQAKANLYKRNLA